MYIHTYIPIQTPPWQALTKLMLADTKLMIVS